MTIWQKGLAVVFCAGVQPIHSRCHPESVSAVRKPSGIRSPNQSIFIAVINART